MADDLLTYNAGQAQTRDQAHDQAIVRAGLISRAVQVFAHTGGLDGKGVPVAPQGTFLWRDELDAAGHPFPKLPRYHTLVETVQPA